MSTVTTTCNHQSTQQKQSINHPANIIISESTGHTSGAIIVRNTEGVNIEQSLSNVRNMASTWHQKSTHLLYGVLGQCYELYFLIESASSSERDRYRDEVKQAYENLNGAQGANTMLGRIVSVVFNFADLDRRQRSRYGSVIKTAFDAEANITNSEEFVGWLKRAGGIVAALDKRTDKVSNTPEQSEINEQIRKLPAKATLTIPNGGNKFVVLLAQPVDKQTVEVLYQFEEDRVGDMLATRAYKAQQKLAKEQETRDTAAQTADELAEQNAIVEEA